MLTERLQRLARGALGALRGAVASGPTRAALDALRGLARAARTWPRSSAALVLATAAALGAWQLRPVHALGSWSIDQPFATATASGWTLGGSAVLTGNGSIDPVGSGWLRLTPAVAASLGWAFHSTAFPTALGLQVEFDWAAYGGSGGEGLGLVFFDGSLATPTPGSAGGLGLAGSCALAGWSGTYLALGLDVRGNYASSALGCPANGGAALAPNRLGVRGAGDGTAGYPLQASAALSVPTAGRSATVGDANYRRLRVTLLPGASGWRLTATARVGAATVVLLDNVAVPAPTATTLRIGLTGASGSTTNVHEIRNFNAGPAPRITGTVFEDVNYGGGAGRARAVALAGGGSGRAGARVELFDSAGALMATTTTDAAGSYAIPAAAHVNQTIRVVSATVSSARPGHVAGLLPVQTYRSDGATGTAVDITDRVGGEDPARADAGNAATTLAALNAAGVTPQSIATVVPASLGLDAMDFGFNFSTVVNVANAGQGSLRQFLTNANALGGKAALAQAGRRLGEAGASEPLPAGTETSIFMIPRGAAVPGIRAGVASALTSGVAVIAPATPLPTLNAAATAIDGTTQTVNVGDTNGVLLGTGGTVGAQGLALPRVPGPEVQLTGVAAIANGLRIQAANVQLRGLSVWGFGAAFDNARGPVFFDGAANATVVLNVIGATATSTADPRTAGVSQYGNALYLLGSPGAVVRGNFVGYGGRGLIADGSSNVTITGNEIVGPTPHTLLEFWQSTNVTVTGNLVRDHTIGIMVDNASGGALVENNTITQTSASGVSVGMSSALVDGATLRSNRITGNTGAGVIFGALATKGVLSGNQIFGNTGLGIDLGGDGVSANDGVLGNGAPNGRIDAPVFTNATLSGTTLTVAGYIGTPTASSAFAGATVEVFASDGHASGRGGARIHLGSIAASSVAGAEGTFAGTLDITGKGFIAGEITGTATLAAWGTSELGPNATVGARVSGTVFEDVNYGGGAGRGLAASGGVPRPGAGVELYDATGALQASTTTDSSGRYEFIVPYNATSYVRVVTTTVSSSRSGWTAGLVPVPTYRTQASAGVVSAVTDRVGGENPALADAAAGAGAGGTLATLGGATWSGSACANEGGTCVFGGTTIVRYGASSSWTTRLLTDGAPCNNTVFGDPLSGAWKACYLPTGLAASIARVEVGSASLAGIDFGFHFATVVNTRDAGQGSLRQAILNANALGGDASLAVSGRSAGREHLVFMIPNGSNAPGLRSGFDAVTVPGLGREVARITVSSALPTIQGPLVIDAQTQPGWAQHPIVELRPSVAEQYAGLTAAGDDLVLRGLLVNRFAQGIVTTGAGQRLLVEGHWIGLDPDGVTPARNGTAGIALAAGTGNDHRVGGPGAAQRNLIAGTTSADAILIGGGARHRIEGNWIGTTAAGVPIAGAIARWGLGVAAGASSVALVGNVVAGAATAGIAINGGSAITVQGNRIGTGASGATAGANGVGVLVESAATGVVIGGSGPGEGNQIGGNTQEGLRLNGALAQVLGNLVGTTADGNAALANGGAGIVVNDASNAIGPGNVVAGNAGWGIEVRGFQNVVSGNLVGLRADGTAALPNASGGVRVTGPLNTIGGAATAAGNVVSGNGGVGIQLNGGAALSNTVAGNRVGTNVAGTGALGNTGRGIEVGGATNVVGGSVAGAGNQVSGNGAEGIAVIAGSGHLIRGNTVGTDAPGAQRLANGGRGVLVTGAGVSATVGGGSATERNLVSGNAADGVAIEAGATATIVGNRIGTDAGGNAALGNTGAGIRVSGAANVTVGGAATNLGNLLSGNGAQGLLLTGTVVAPVTGAVVLGNLIGANAADAAALPNGQSGIGIVGEVRDSRIGGTAAGEANVLRGNGGAGVGFDTSTGTPVRNRLSGNAIHGNTALGIRLQASGVPLANDGSKPATSANLGMDHPVIAVAARLGGELYVSGYVGSAAGQSAFANATVELFVSDDDPSGFGEGRSYLGALLTASTDGSFAGRLPLPSGVTITAGSTRLTGTATDASGNTSEFGPNVTISAGIAGRVYEDLNYGGGAGRDWAAAQAAGAQPVANARVELYRVSDGAFVAATLTDTAGRYVLPVAAAGSARVRVATGTVRSSRPGNAADQWPVSTYRAGWVSGATVGLAGSVGGPAPAAQDPGSNTTNAAWSTLVASASSQPTAWTELAITAVSQSPEAIDFGFHFGTVVNTRDAGQGSLRQAILNANALGGDAALAVTGRSAGREHLIFMIPNGSNAPGLDPAFDLFTTAGRSGDVATIVSQSEMPAITAPLSIDAQIQPGWIGDPIIELRPSVDRAYHGVSMTGGGVTLRGLIVNRFREGVYAYGAGNGYVIQGCWIGLAPDGLSAPGNGVSGIWLSGGSGNGHLIGGTQAAARNLIAGSVADGLAIATGDDHLIQGNWIGLAADGSTQRSIGASAVRLYGGNRAVVGGTAPGAGNVIAGGGNAGVHIMGGAGHQLLGNRIGTTPDGNGARPNTLAGVLVEGSASAIRIGSTVSGGSTVVAGNQISGNAQRGIWIRTGTSVIHGNRIGTNAAGTAALGNGFSGIVLENSAGPATIGGADPAEGNLVSGNAFEGVLILTASAAGTTVRGNRIGTDLSGSLAVANRGVAGVRVAGNATGVLIGGAAAGEGNLVSGNGGRGISISAGRHDLLGNLIGLRADGAAALPNAWSGIVLDPGAENVRIGGTAPGAGNTISGNLGSGVWIDGPTASGTTLRGNRIGTGLDGRTLIGNGRDGVSLRSGSSGDILIGGTAEGEGNVIAGNGEAGVRIDIGTRGNWIQRNAIHSNGTLGIDLAWGGATGPTPNDGVSTNGRPNWLIDHPVLTSARARGNRLTVAGYVGLAPGSSAFAGARIELFESDGDASGYGEGRTWLGALTAAADGTFSGTITMATPVLRRGTLLTATATDALRNTSEFGPTFTALVVDTVVNHPGDAVDAAPGDGLCETATSGQCTLRAAIQEVNAWAGAGALTIAFDLPACPGAGCTIAPATPLPALARATTTIDAQTQAGWSRDPVVVLSGASAGAGTAGLVFTAASPVLRGMVIGRFDGAGVAISAGASGATVQGNWIGLGAAGEAGQGNRIGVQVAAPGFRLGGTTGGERNVLSGNGQFGLELLTGATGATVVGNWFGTNGAGTQPVPNGQHGLRARAGTTATIGGAAAGEGNVFAGATLDAASLEGAGGTIRGNLFGIAPDGVTPMGNTRHAVHLMAGSWVVGGPVAADGNRIAHNGGIGVLVSPGATATVRRNAIGGNGGLGIDLGQLGALDAGVGDGPGTNDGVLLAPAANRGIDHPVFQSAGTDGTVLAVSGYIGLAPGQPVFAGATVDVYRADGDPSGRGEGPQWLGSLTVDGTGRYAGNLSLAAGQLAVGQSVTATVTDADGNTSEFGPNTVSATLAASPPARLNAFEPATPAGALTGVLRTRTAGLGATVDVIALDALGGALHSAFTGTVAIEWLDARDSAAALDVGGCRASWLPVGAAGSVSFSAGDGARRSVTLTPPEAGREWRLRLTATQSGRQVVACSTDAFAVKPASLVLTVAGSNASGTGPGTAAGRSLLSPDPAGGVVHRAGRPFALRAQARAVGGAPTQGYDGRPTLLRTGCLLPASGCLPGTLSVGAATTSAGVWSTDAATYSEVGAFQARLEDADFAAVDAADTTAADRLIVGAEVAVGRFVPDRYLLAQSTEPRLATAHGSCAASGAGFTFAGQAFGWRTPPQVSVQAVAADGTPTVNWTGSLQRFAPTAVTRTLQSPGAPTALASAWQATTVSDAGGGRALVAFSGADRFWFQRNDTAPQASFVAAPTLSVTVSDASEAAVPGNGTIDGTAPLALGTAGTLAFDAGAAIHHGRLVVHNAFGDARRPLQAVIEVQRYSADRGWLRLADAGACLTVPAGAWSYTAGGGALAGGLECRAAPAPAAIALTHGRGLLTLPKIVDNRAAAMTVILNAGTAPEALGCTGPAGAAVAPTPMNASHLLTARPGGTGLDRNPAARVSWGQPRVAWMSSRELF